MECTLNTLARYAVYSICCSWRKRAFFAKSTRNDSGGSSDCMADFLRSYCLELCHYKSFHYFFLHINFMLPYIAFRS